MITFACERIWINNQHQCHERPAAGCEWDVFRTTVIYDTMDKNNWINESSRHSTCMAHIKRVVSPFIERAYLTAICLSFDAFHLKGRFILMKQFKLSIKVTLVYPHKLCRAPVHGF